MTTLTILSLYGWTASILFLVRQLWAAPQGYEDASGFHAVTIPVSRWHHVHFRHHRRSHRVQRHTQGA
jgi:hypothetical protein